MVFVQVGPHWVNVAEIAAITVGQADHPPSGTVRFDMHVVLRSGRRVTCSWHGQPVQRRNRAVWPQRDERDAAVTDLLARMTGAFKHMEGACPNGDERLFEVDA